MTSKERINKELERAEVDKKFIENEAAKVGLEVYDYEYDYSDCTAKVMVRFEKSNLDDIGGNDYIKIDGIHDNDYSIKRMFKDYRNDMNSWWIEEYLQEKFEGSKIRVNYQNYEPFTVEIDQNKYRVDDSVNFYDFMDSIENRINNLEKQEKNNEIENDMEI